MHQHEDDPARPPDVAAEPTPDGLTENERERLRFHRWRLAEEIRLTVRKFPLVLRRAQD